MKKGISILVVVLTLGLFMRIDVQAAEQKPSEQLEIAVQRVLDNINALEITLEQKQQSRTPYQEIVECIPNMSKEEIENILIQICDHELEMQQEELGELSEQIKSNAEFQQQIDLSNEKYAWVYNMLLQYGEYRTPCELSEFSR